jgi:hypothetical protein
LNKLIKADKTNATEYYIYDYQGNRVRSVVEFNNQVQNQRDYLPSLDISRLGCCLCHRCKFDGKILVKS